MFLKLTNLNLLSFGKMKERAIPLNDGLNIIFGENEAGKSTVMAFIRAMMFGFGDKKADIKKSDRARFTPWSGEKLAGEMTFTHEGKTYRLTRIGGKTKASDSFSVIDAETGLEVEFNMEENLSIGEGGYMETAFIRQLGSSFAGNDEVTARLLNLSESGQEDTSLKKSLELLEKMFRVLRHKKGSGGAIGDLQQELFDLRHAHSVAVEEREETARHMEEKKECEQKLERVRPRLLELSKELSEREKNILYKELDGLRKEEEKKKDRLQVAEEELAREQSLFKEYEIFEGSSTCPFGAEEPTEDVKWEISREEEKKKLALPLTIIGAVIALLSVVGGIFYPILFLGILLGAFLIALGLYKKGASEKLLLHLEERLKEKEEKNTARKEFLAGFGAASPEEYNEKRSQYMTSRAKMEVLLKGVQNARTEWEEIKTKKEEKEEEIKSRFGSLEEYVPTEISADALAEKERLEQEQLFLSERIATLSALLSGEEKATPSEIEAEIKVLEDRLASYRKNEEALSLAIESLTFAHEELSRDFAPRLNRRASEILNALTGGAHGEILMTKDYKIELRDREMHGIDYFSNGTADQVYFALRLALSELIFEGKEVPIILDDPFTQYDEKREQKAMEFLKEYAKENQVILFTARPLEEPTFTL